MRHELLNLAHRLAAEDEPFVLATVVRREAPTSAQLGDAAIITADGEFHGWLGGACTRDLVVREALAALGRGAPRLVLLTADPDASRGNGVRVLPMTCHSGGSVEVYLDPQMPRRELVLFGDSDVARALARLAPELGFRVTRRGERPAAGESGGATAGEPGGATARPASRPFVAIATYGESDEAALREALALEPAYVALVSGRRRFAAMREILIAGGLDPEALGRVSSPAGLDIGAVTPSEIALSILAEMVQVRRAGDVADGAGSPGATETGSPGAMEAGTVTDPVCGMTVATGSPHRAEHRGAIWHFCCDGCRQRFLATPDAFSSQASSIHATRRRSR